LQLLRMLETSRHRICITNAYFNPSPRVLKTLKRKSEEGLDVQLLVPRRSDIVFFPLLSRSFYADLLQAGIRVYEYHERILHSKTMIIDDYLIVGSTNLNYRSLFHDLELDLLITDPVAVGQMEQRFASDVGASIEITFASWQKYPWLGKLLGLLSRFLRYWL
jgi:cardiolipin synthase